MLISAFSETRNCLVLAGLALFSLPASAALVATDYDSGAPVTVLNLYYNTGETPQLQKTLLITNGTVAVTDAQATIDTNALGSNNQPIFSAYAYQSIVAVGVPNPDVLTGQNGVKTGNLHIVAAGLILDIPITLRINAGAPGTVTADQTSLTFTAAIGGQPQQQQITLSGPGTASYTTQVTAGAAWIAVGPGSTIAVNPTVTVTVNPALVSDAGVYTGTVKIASPDSPDINVNITLNLGTGALVVSPASLVFSYNPTTQVLATAQQALNVSSGANASVYSVVVTSTGGWLYVNGSNQGVGLTAIATPLTVTVPHPENLSSGSSGSITVADNLGNQVQVNVTLNVSSASTVALSATSLTFSGPVGAPPTAQIIQLSSTHTGITYTAAVAQSFVQVSPSAGAVPGNLTVTVNPAGLSAGPQYASVVLTYYQNGVQIGNAGVSISYTVGGPGGIDVTTVAPTTLSFVIQAGSVAGILSQEVAVTGAGETYSATYATSSGGGWLTIGTNSGIVPGKLAVGINQAVASMLAAGDYAGTVTVQAAYSSVSVAVNLKVTTGAALIASPPSVTVLCPTAATCPTVWQYFLLTSTGRTVAIAGAYVNGWITLSGVPSKVTPAALAATFDTSWLVSGVNSGSIQVISDADNSSLTIPVTFVIGAGSGGTAPVTISPASLSFTGARGTSPNPQQLTVSTVQPSAVFTASASSTGNWLSVDSGTYEVTAGVPANVIVSVNAAALSVNTYSGSVTISGGGVDQVVNVTLTVKGSGAPANLSVPGTPLLFRYVVGGRTPADQTLRVSSTEEQIPFTASASSSGNWLSISPENGTTQADVTVRVNPLGVPAGNYTGIITVDSTSASNSPRTVNVTLTVTDAPQLSASPASLSFTYHSGGETTPSAQPVAVTSSGEALSYTAAADSNWLTVFPAAGKTAGSVDIGVNPAGLDPGKYIGKVNIVYAGDIPSSVVVDVAFTVTAPMPTVSRVVGAASYRGGPLAPGEIVSLFGDYIGPDAAVTQQGSNGRVTTTLGNVQVFFGGYAAPLTLVSANQIKAIVPYAMDGRSTASVWVSYQDFQSNAILVSLAPSAPGIFTVDDSGTGQALISNQDGSVNSENNPAARGSTVTINITGEGRTNPAGVDGKIYDDLANLPKPVLPVSVTIDGKAAKVIGCGATPNLVAGNTRIIAEVPVGAAIGVVPVKVQVGAAASQDGVTMVVR